jgi:UDP:flavonoid glycosyltransferase YjiC (YdhE family)
MKALFTLLPATGSLHPLLPLARNLMDSGHQVLFACAPSFRAEVEQHGFESRPAGLDFLFSRPDYFQILVAEAAVDVPPLSGYERQAWVTNNLFIGAAGRRMLPDVVSLAQAWEADVIVRESSEYSGCVAAEKLGIPHASVAAPADGALDLREVTRHALDQLRCEAGLGTDPSAEMAYRYLHLCFTPPAFYGSDARFPATVRFIRHVDAPWSAASAQLWDKFDRRRTAVMASLGTIFFRTPGLLEAIVAALREEKVNLLVAIGADQDPARLGPQPVNVRIERYLPIPELLPRCELFITHGGFNSVKEALSAGVPMLVIPIASDQHFSADRCEAIGVGRVVRPHERTPEQINRQALAILRDPAYRLRAEALSHEMGTLPPLEHAVSLIERLVKMPESRATL